MLMFIIRVWRDSNPANQTSSRARRHQGTGTSCTVLFSLCIALSVLTLWNQISKDSPTDRITLPANILNNDVHEDMFKWYSDITSQLSFLSGIEVKTVHEGEISLKLVNSVLQCEHEMVIRIDSVNKKLMDLQVRRRNLSWTPRVCQY